MHFLNCQMGKQRFHLDSDDQETKAPDGYLTEDEVVVRKILPEL